MDKRSLLLGLGIGMVMGAILMQLFLIGEQTSNDLQNKDETINGIQSPIFSSPESENSEINNTENSVQDEATNSKDEESEPEASPTPISDNQLNSDTENREYSEEEKFPNTLLLRVYSGATVSETAEVLFNNNIIDDKDSFVTYVRSKAKLRAGYFFINRHLTNDQALKILSGSPLSDEEALEAEQSNKYNIIFSP